MTFKTSPDSFAKGATVIYAVLSVSFILLPFLFDRTGIFLLFIPALLLLLYACIYIIRPIDYILTPEKLIIHRHYRSVLLEKTNIRSIELIDKKILRSSIRTFGVGGLFGYFGRFYNFKVGNMTWYATRKDRGVLIKTNDNRNIVLTPDDPDGLIAACKL